MRGSSISTHWQAFSESASTTISFDALPVITPIFDSGKALNLSVISSSDGKISCCFFHVQPDGGIFFSNEIGITDIPISNNSRAVFNIVISYLSFSIFSSHDPSHV